MRCKKRFKKAMLMHMGHTHTNPTGYEGTRSKKKKKKEKKRKKEKPVLGDVLPREFPLKKGIP